MWNGTNQRVKSIEFYNTEQIDSVEPGTRCIHLVSADKWYLEEVKLNYEKEHSWKSKPSLNGGGRVEERRRGAKTPVLPRRQNLPLVAFADGIVSTDMATK